MTSFKRILLLVVMTVYGLLVEWWHSRLFQRTSLGKWMVDKLSTYDSILSTKT